ncbi:MAG: hypothetical protein V1807_02810 [Patescibacteria group bacterium]
MGTETLESIDEEIEEIELLPAEVAVLRAEMQSKIAEAVALGVFTDKEAKEWENGFEACDRLEYMENLVEIVDDFIASGLEVVEQIAVALDTDLLTDREKAAWEIQMEMLSFEDKRELLSELVSIIKQVANYKQQLLQLLKTHSLPVNKAKELIKNFESTEADKKEGVVTRTAFEVIAARDQCQVVQSQVRGLVSTEQFSAARKILSENQIFTSGEYAELVGEIDAAEINQARQLAQAA